MSNLPQPARRYAVIGGGMSGLAAAFRLSQLDPQADLTLLEASDRLGGVLETVRRDGFLIERSADNFITTQPWAIDLARRIGFEDQLLETNDAVRRAMVVHNGRLLPVPPGFLLMVPKRVWPVLTSPILSPAGKLRLAWEYFVPPRRESGDESLASFVGRRLGREALERLVQPLVAGIYTADPKKLSMAATFAKMQAMERDHGGLIRAARAEKKRQKAVGGRRKTEGSSSREPVDSGARYSMFVAPREGMSSFVEAIAARLPHGAVRLGCAVERIETIGSGWSLVLQHAGEPLACDGVIVATPAPIAAQLVASVDDALAAELAGIQHAGSSVVVLGYRREQIGHALDGFGFVVPAIENRRILAGSFSSIKFPGRAPEGSVLLRVFVGGALQPQLAELADEELLRLVTDELAELLDVRGAPTLTEVVRWPAAMPQYHLGHVERAVRIESKVAKLPGLELAGNAYQGVGVPHCIHSGETAAERLANTETSIKCPNAR